MKIQKTFFALLLLAASTIFVGCNANKFDVAPETSTKTEYTASEKAEIYALAEKYELEIVPMEQKQSQSLKSVKELEDMFKKIYKQNNTKIPLVKTKDGTYTTKKMTSSRRIKTYGEVQNANFYFLQLYYSKEYCIYGDISVSLNLTEASVSPIVSISNPGLTSSEGYSLAGVSTENANRSYNLVTGHEVSFDMRFAGIKDIEGQYSYVKYGTASANVILKTPSHIVLYSSMINIYGI